MFKKDNNIFVCHALNFLMFLVLSLGIADAATRHIASLVERQKKTSPKRKTRLTTYRPESLPVVPHFIRTQIKELLSSYPSGLLGSMFCIAFNRRFGQELNYSTLRFQSLGHLLESIPDIARIEDMKGRRGFRVYGRGVDVNLGMYTAVVLRCTGVLNSWSKMIMI